MLNRSAKRVVVIKDIPSNLIEEAIFILKGDPDNKYINNSKETLNKSKKNDDFLIKEAHMIINNYIKGNPTANDYLNLNLKPLNSKRSFLTNTFINLALAFSIALLIFIISKAI
ncbi:MAG: hypothetical protein N2645_05645 [Clostridia bacterium]|nr:hypothetical protein [Clostridia bacterium]